MTTTGKRRAPAEPGSDRNGANALTVNRERIVARILKAAEAEFGRHGYAGAATSEIARRAGIPKPSLYYYFPTKEQLYLQVIENILDLWLGALDDIKPEADPAEALAAYIRNKISYSRDWPELSRIYAIEVIGGGKHIQTFMRTRLRQLVKDKGQVLAQWAKAGKIEPVDPAHFFFLLWTATQTYADFAAQIAAVLGQEAIDDEVFDDAVATVTRFVLKGLGLTPPAPRKRRRTPPEG